MQMVELIQFFAQLLTMSHDHHMMGHAAGIETTTMHDHAAMVGETTAHNHGGGDSGMMMMMQVLHFKIEFF